MKSMKRFSFLLVLLFGISLLPVTVFSYDKEHLDVLLKGVEAWNALRKGEPQRRFDLSGADLRGKNLKKVDFSNTDLTGAVLKGSNMSEADLRGASFDKAMLKGALLYDAILHDASLQEAVLEEAGLDGADFRAAVLDGANLKQADLANSILRESSLKGADFRSADLRAADLAGADLDGAYLWRAVLDGAHLEGAVVTPVTVVETGKYADREWAEKNQALLVMTEVVGSAAMAAKNSDAVAPEKQVEEVSAEKSAAVFSEPAKESRVPVVKSDDNDTAAVIERSWPANPVRQKIRFGAARAEAAALPYDVHQRELLTDSVSRWNKMRKKNPDEPIRLSGAKLNGKMLDGADLRNADLGGASLKRADLVEADMRGADLAGANLRQADLTNADLQGANLQGAYLWMANMSWAVLKGVIVDAGTVLETGKKATPEWAEKNGAVYRRSEN